VIRRLSLRRLGAAVSVFLTPLALAAIETPNGVPRPKGWIGTETDWARGLGIAFAALDLLLLLSVWRSTRRSGVNSGSKQLLFIGIVVLPLAIVFFGYSFGLEASKDVQACGACHVMTPYVDDLHNPKSDTLAAVHFKNRYIQTNHCYTCHTDYGMSGTVKAKWEGLGHTVRYTTRNYELPLKIAHPYPNWRCLNCHATSQKFLDPAKHPLEDREALLSGKTSCIDCHGPAHPRPEKKASR
jgi:nitrate/TMAO reductase-like tetraheme cytochrome c subunit